MKKILFISAILITNLTIAQIPVDGLVGYWPFDGNANDASGNGYDGIVEGPTLTDGKDGEVNSAYYFNANDINLGQISALNFNPENDAFTIAAWVKTSSNGGFIISKAFTDASTRQYGIYTQNGTLRAVIGGVSSNSEVIINDDTWQHIAIVMPNSAPGTFYINGVADDNSITRGSGTSTADILVGSRRGDDNSTIAYGLTGSIDDLRIYNRELTAGEIEILFNQTPPSTATYTLTTTASPVEGGSITLDPAGGIYNEGTVVTLTASPASGYNFTSWTGDASGTSLTTTVTISADLSVTANFNPVPTYTLTINITPTESGTITLDPAGGIYEEGTMVTLTASPASGYNFTSWTGDASGTSLTTTVTMSADLSVTANFEEIPTTIYNLIVNINPLAGGSVTIDPAGSEYDEGTVVTLTAAPNTDYTFLNWSGDATGTGLTTTVTMNADLIVNANFESTIIDLENGLVAHYPFNGNTNDESGNGNDPVLSSNDNYIIDRFSISNSALDCTDENQAIGLDNSTFTWGSNAFTISYWIQTGTNITDDHYLWQQTSGDNSSAVLINQSSGDFNIYVRDQDGNGISDQYIGYTITPNTYYHVVLMRRTNGDVRFYVNDNQEYAGFSDGAINITGYTSVAVQDNGAQYHFNGVIDDIKVYNRSLNVNEITALYNEPPDNSPSDTLGGQWIREGNTIYYLDGNVGIGTTDPGSYSLSVNGRIRAKEVRVETGWADYVFDDNYKLMTLEELKKYIEENKRLPLIPGEDQVVMEGISLGEVNRLLLQKIEEISLYLIELKNENIEIKQQIKEIQEQTNTDNE